jgi:hypothetical protein
MDSNLTLHFSLSSPIFKIINQIPISVIDFSPNIFSSAVNFKEPEVSKRCTSERLRTSSLSFFVSFSFE